MSEAPHPTKPHKWKGGDNVDVFAYEAGFHNGPECEVCGYYFCQHCNPEGWGTECGVAEAEPGSNANLDPGMVALDASIRARAGLRPMV